MNILKISLFFMHIMEPVCAFVYGKGKFKFLSLYPIVRVISLRKYHCPLHKKKSRDDFVSSNSNRRGTNSGQIYVHRWNH